MKLGGSQSLVQSDDAVNIHPSGAGRQRLEARITKFVFSLLVLASRTPHPCNTIGPVSEGNRQDAEPQALLAGVGVGGFRLWGDSGGWRR